MKKWITGRRRAIGAGAVGVVVAAVVSGSLWASDHQDTPTVEFTPRFDINDVYAFPAATAGRTVLVLGTSSPLSPAQTATHTFGNVSDQLYQLKIDNTGDAIEDLVFQITFTGPSNAQVVSVRGPVVPNETGLSNTLVGAGNLVVGPVNSNLGTAPGVQVFAGPRDDPFWIDLEWFFRILPDRRPAAGPLSPFPPSASSFRQPGAAVDFLRGFNDLAIVIELPTAMLTNSGANPRFGVWGTISRVAH
jgi:hypothetical protein